MERLKDKAKLNPRVFFDISIAGRPAGRLNIELYADTTPLTAENFRCLCTGEKGVGPASKKPLHYKGTILHRVIAGFMAQGGDFQHRNGTGGESIYGKEFRDENFIRKHQGPGMLSMANAGPHTNGSQFFLTFQSTPHLNGKHVVFGRVTSGLDVLKAIEAVRTNSKDDRPVQDVVIAECGEIKEGKEGATTTAAATDATQKKRVVEDDDDANVQHELPAASSAASSAAASAASSSAPATAFPVSRGSAHLDLIHSTLQAASAEETKLRRELAEKEAQAKKDGRELHPRERKLMELKLKRIAGSKANAQGVASEAKKNELASLAAANGGDPEKKKQVTNAEFQARKQNWEEEQAKAGVDPALAFLHDTAEATSMRDAKGRKKNGNPDSDGKPASFGWAVFNQDAQFNAYEKRLNFLPTGSAGAAAASGGGGSAQPMNGVESTSLLARSIPAQSAAAAAAAAQAKASEGQVVTAVYGGVNKPSKAGVDRMVAELAEGQKRKEKFSRRRAFNEDEDVNYINERNRIFNKKAMRAYEPYTLEIKQNIERGTAL